jgi:hypothetical protein
LASTKGSGLMRMSLMLSSIMMNLPRAHGLLRKCQAQDRIALFVRRFAPTPFQRVELYLIHARSHRTRQPYSFPSSALG